MTHSDNGDCLGWRGGPNKEYVWLSYGDVEDRAKAFGAGLCKLGVDVGQDSFVGIYCHNTVEVRGRGGREERERERERLPSYSYLQLTYIVILGVTFNVSGTVIVPAK